MTKEKFKPQTEEMIVDFDLTSDESFIELPKKYKIVEHPDNPNAEYMCVEVLRGEFAGLIYRYGRFKIAGRDNPDDTRTIQYEYDVIKVPEHIKGVKYPDEKEREFSQLLGTILMDIVNKWVEHNNEETILMKDEDVENRIDDTEKLVARRSVYPPGNPFSKE